MKIAEVVFSQVTVYFVINVFFFCILSEQGSSKCQTMAVTDTILEYLKGKHLYKFLGQMFLLLFFFPFPSNIVPTVHVFNTREAGKKNKKHKPWTVKSHF